MQDHATRLVGLDGLVVTEVQRAGEQFDLQVELLARATGCPHCGGIELRVKERPLVRVRDLPIAGRLTEVVWRKRRYRSAECGRTFTETHEQLPARQRVTAGSARAWASEWRMAPPMPRSRARSAPPATRSRAPSPTAPTGSRRARTGRGACRWTRRTTAAVMSWPRWSPTWTVAA
jgi:zinc-finger of transposase IS204/IS1001/IS1096/IS1165